MSAAVQTQEEVAAGASQRKAVGNVLLKVSGLKVGYGGIQAVKGVDFEVREGELVSLIGSNGAGKTTTMKAITGTLPAGAGDIEFLGRSIKGRGAWDLVGEGLVMVPEGRGVFTRMTITENLQIGAYIRKDKALTIVFIQHPDGSSEEFHGGRQNGSKTKSCPLVQSDLSKDEKTVWKRAMQKLQRDGKLLELYEEHVSLAL